MKSVLALALALVLAALACAACSTTPEAREPRKPDTWSGEGPPKIKFGEPSSSSESAADAPAAPSARRSGEPGVLDYAMVPVENVVYLPWKLIGGAGKGVADGVGAGFSKDRMPILGVLFLPLNVVAGFLTGAVEGVVDEPGFVGPRDSFGRAMAMPVKRSTTIWWYE